MDWISTEERLPDSFGDYLCIIDGKSSGHRMGMKTFFDSENQHGFLVGEDEKVTYWMELPDYPTTKNNPFEGYVYNFEEYLLLED